MPTFIAVHRGAAGASPDQLRAAHEAALAAQDAEGVQLEHAWFDTQTGAAFLLSTGPSVDAVARVHASAGRPVDEIHQVDVEVH